MATASIERRLKRLLAARDAEYAERARKQRPDRHYRRRRLKWTEKQAAFRDAVRARRMPASMRRQDPIEVLWNAAIYSQMTPAQRQYFAPQELRTKPITRVNTEGV
jgi:hypothetical protein